MTPLANLISWIEHVHDSTDWYEVGRFVSAAVVALSVAILVYAALTLCNCDHLP